MSIYTLLPLISGISVLLLGTLVLTRNRRLKVNQVFFLTTLFIVIWLFATSMMFSSKTDEQSIFWDRIVYIGVVFIPITVYHFGLLFAKIKKQKKLLYLGYFLSFIFLILSRTNYFVEDLYRYSWGVHTQARFFHHIFLGFFTFYIALFFFNIYRYYKESKGIERIQANYVLLAFFILAISSSAFLPAYGINIPPFSYLFAVICVLILSLAITRYHLFEIRVIATELLVGLIAIILLIQALIAPVFQLKVFGVFLLILFSMVGYFLIKSILKEIELRKKLQMAYAELQKLDKAKSEFVSIASHQLRTPLTAIKGYISMMLEKIYGEPPEKMAKPLKNIYLSNERLIKLVNDLLNISRIEADRMEMQLEKTSLEEMVTSLVEELKNSANEKNIYLKTDFPQERRWKMRPKDSSPWEKPEKPLPKISVDKEKIRQVIMNVVDNAIRYTEHGGVTVQIQNQKSKIKIIVKDTGTGLTKYELSKMFESFSRGAAGTRLYTEGVGLGLYVAKKFVEMHNGKIWAESKGKDKGSTFYIELPLK